MSIGISLPEWVRFLCFVFSTEDVFSTKVSPTTHFKDDFFKKISLGNSPILANKQHQFCLCTYIITNILKTKFKVSVCIITSFSGLLESLELEKEGPGIMHLSTQGYWKCNFPPHVRCWSVGLSMSGSNTSMLLSYWSFFIEK